MSAGAKQRAVVAEHLKRYRRMSTLEFRELGIMSPASRIMELRRRGWVIDLLWRCELDHVGEAHRTGVYVLRVAGAIC